MGIQPLAARSFALDAADVRCLSLEFSLATVFSSDSRSLCRGNPATARPTCDRFSFHAFVDSGHDSRDDLWWGRAIWLRDYLDLFSNRGGLGSGGMVSSELDLARMGSGGRHLCHFVGDLHLYSAELWRAEI